MPVPKFSFVPEKQMNEERSEGYRVSVRKNFILYFPSDVVKVYDLEGKYAKFYVDVQKRTLGWQIIEDKTELADLNAARLMKPQNPKTSAVTFGIGKILKGLGFDKDDEFPNLEVRKYSEPLTKGDIWYVTFRKESKVVS